MQSLTGFYNKKKNRIKNLSKGLRKTWLHLVNFTLEHLLLSTGLQTGLFSTLQSMVSNFTVLVMLMKPGYMYLTSLQVMLGTIMVTFLITG